MSTPEYPAWLPFEVVAWFFIITTIALVMLAGPSMTQIWQAEKHHALSFDPSDPHQRRLHNLVIDHVADLQDTVLAVLIFLPWCTVLLFSNPPNISASTAILIYVCSVILSRWRFWPLETQRYDPADWAAPFQQLVAALGRDRHSITGLQYALAINAGLSIVINRSLLIAPFVALAGPLLACALMFLLRRKALALSAELTCLAQARGTLPVVAKLRPKPKA